MDAIVEQQAKPVSLKDLPKEKQEALAATYAAFQQDQGRQAEYIAAFLRALGVEKTPADAKEYLGDLGRRSGENDPTLTDEEKRIVDGFNALQDEVGGAYRSQKPLIIEAAERLLGESSHQSPRSADLQEELDAAILKALGQDVGAPTPQNPRPAGRFLQSLGVEEQCGDRPAGHEGLLQIYEGLKAEALSIAKPQQEAAIADAEPTIDQPSHWQEISTRQRGMLQRSASKVVDVRNQQSKVEAAFAKEEEKGSVDEAERKAFVARRDSQRSQLASQHMEALDGFYKAVFHTLMIDNPAEYMKLPEADAGQVADAGLPINVRAAAALHDAATSITGENRDSDPTVVLYEKFKALRDGAMKAAEQSQGRSL